ncbi:Serine/threonine protein kinase [Nonomuraea solani]|uniref:non-specific serine/threonine protein kinase n=1 Tax=Nonomuraea solani TaxID=1144553 RepID=A0A1H6EWG8_9ACTN|nr:serine/threonine protein kinase [Nonomuraea solani]SEH01219.1 Serine/threonine protein kinase [Nonomuraea solani]
MPNADPLRPGDPEVIAAYRIVGRLGEGGQGIVYLGQAPDGRPVAVKVLRQAAGGDRFAKEIAAARRVEPFCVAQVLDASLGGRPYIVSEYVEGPSLQRKGRHHGADLQRLAVSTATALAAIHQAGIVHRDFKPANVLLGRDGPRVIDFGIARAADSAVTVTSSVVGTPAYMAPEQLAGAYVGPAADVFAWASVIVFAGTGTPPFGEDSLPAVINRVLNQEPFLGDLPDPLRSVVYACLAKDPNARPRMQDVLLRLIGGRPEAPIQRQPWSGAPNPVMSGPVPPRRPRSRFPLIAGVSGAVAVCLTAGVVIWNASLDKTPESVKLAARLGEREPTPSVTASPKRQKTSTPTGKKTTRTRTPSAAPKTTRPAPSPSQRRTTARPTPTKQPTTARPTPTRKPATSRPSPTRTKAKAASFTLAYVRMAGKSRINQEGVTCYYGAMTFGVGLDSSETGAPFSYQWLVDGQVIESGSRRIPSHARSDYFGSKREITLELGSRHTVTFQLTSPVRRAMSKSWTMC